MMTKKQLTPRAPRAALAALAALAGVLAPPLSAPARADELLQTLREGELEIDGSYQDWHGARRVSFEHLVGATRATLSDLRGALSVAISAERLFVLVEGADDDLALSGPRGDTLTLTLTGGGEGRDKRWRADLTIDLAPLAKGGDPRVLRGRRPLPGAQAKGQLSREGRGGAWRLEASLPLRALPPLLGRRVGLAGVLRDVDAGALDSIYATELLTKDLAPERARWLMGGNAAYRVLYETKTRRPLAPLFERTAQVTGDAREETLYITAEELVLLGPDLPSGGTAVSFAHGWGGAGMEVSVEEVRWEVSGRLLRVARHERPRVPPADEDERVALRVEELYALDAGGLTRVLAQVTEARVGASARAAVDLSVLGDGREVRVSAARLQGLTREELTRALPPRAGLTPMLGEDGAGRARRYVRGAGGYALSRR